jgi:hypothetical protein
MNLHNVQKALRPIVAEAIGRGCWKVQNTKRGTGHSLRLVHESGRIVPLHCSRVSEGRAPKQLRSQLRRIERELDT